MARILCLAPSGFGKSTGTGHIEALGFIGLDPSESYIISVTSKPLPYRGSEKIWPRTTPELLRSGRRIVSNDAEVIADTIRTLYDSPVKNVVVDDFNYIMQDWYMANALRTGWDAPKSIGYKMGRIFDAIELFQEHTKNVIVLAHGEDVPSNDGSGRKYTKMKTTGKMVDEYVTPEGKFDITLVGRSRFDQKDKRVIKEYVTNEDENLSSPKSPIGMFEQKYIPNDLGLVIQTVNSYYGE